MAVVKKTCIIEEGTIVEGAKRVKWSTRDDALLCLRHP